MTPAQERKGFRVIIVDDDDLDRYIIARSFLSLADPVELIEVADATTAADAIRINQPDITLLDMQMPGATGFDVLDALVGGSATTDPRPPVLMLSSSTRDVDRQTALEKGAVAYHVKPATLDGFKELAEHIRSTYLM